MWSTRRSFKNVSGLKPGSEVHLAGVTVGSVKEIIISPDGRTKVTFNVIKKYSDQIREDSQASIGFMGLLGDKSLDLTAGSPGKPAIPPNGLVASIEPLDMTQLLAKAGPSLEDLQKILDNLASITEPWWASRAVCEKSSTNPGNRQQDQPGPGYPGAIRQ